ncbi:MAG: hypothetical protein J0L94_05815 [Rhodothermia bacterium]|nr:hypothetical protein [Rhodothermia bacterium]
MSLFNFKRSVRVFFGWGVLCFLHTGMLQAQETAGQANLRDSIQTDSAFIAPKPDTIRVAVWPFQYTGLLQKETDLAYASGLRLLLGAYLSAYSTIRTSDRVEMQEVLQMAQLSRFGPESQSIPLDFEGADYIIMGQYFMRNRTSFAHLQVRMFSVKNGAILAERHLNLPRLSIERVPAFLQAFAQDVATKLERSEATPDFSSQVTCKKGGIQWLMQAAADREAAFVMEDLTLAVEKLDKAIVGFERSKIRLCGSGWLDREISETQNMRNALRRILDSPIEESNEPKKP